MPQSQAEPLGSRLRSLGHEVVLCPLIRIEPTGDEPIDVAEYDWVVVTSPNGASELARRARGVPRRIAAVGPGTAHALVARGLIPEVVARVSTQEGLLAELPQPAGRVLFAGAEDARALLSDELAADVVVLYRTIELSPPPPAGDFVVLASASAARAFGSLGASLPVVSIGPQTSAAARAAGLEVIAEAEPHDLDGLVAAVATLGL